MRSEPLALLGSRRFLPLFLTQFLGALNDNLFKNAMVILIVYRLAEPAGLSGAILSNLAAGLFILPFFLFSAPAGRLADGLEKSSLIRLIKACEIGIMLVGSMGLFLRNISLLFVVLFLMGSHSAFFGPLKYSILPNHLRPSELLAGNALIEAGTFLAILLGTIAGGLLVLDRQGAPIVSAGLLLVALVGYAASRFIPRAAPPARASGSGLEIDLNVLRDGWRLVRVTAADGALFGPILGISWFWLVGATFLSQFPALTKDVVGGDETIVTLFLTGFTVGIALGSLLCSRVLRGEVSLRLVPLGALGISVFAIDLFFACRQLTPPTAALMGLGGFFASPANWRVLIDLVLIAGAGGVYIVPLYATLQLRSADDQRSRVIASNNIVNAVFMVAAALVTAALLAAGFSVPGVLLALGLANLAVVGCAARRSVARRVAPWAGRPGGGPSTGRK